MISFRLEECGDSLRRLAQLLCDAFEFEELPVRHNEDELNAELAKVVPWEVRDTAMLVYLATTINSFVWLSFH